MSPTRVTTVSPSSDLPFVHPVRDEAVTNSPPLQTSQSLDFKRNIRGEETGEDARKNIGDKVVVKKVIWEAIYEQIRSI